MGWSQDAGKNSLKKPPFWGTGPSRLSVFIGGNEVSIIIRQTVLFIPRGAAEKEGGQDAGERGMTTTPKREKENDGRRTLRPSERASEGERKE